nr:hypothetical protein [Lachnospiraceae bacterium]
MIAILPQIAAWILYLRKPESVVVRHIVGSGFGLLYAFILFTSELEIVYLYAIPLIVIITIYGDVTYTAAIAFGTVILNAISVAITMSHGVTGDEITSLPMRVV